MNEADDIKSATPVLHCSGRLQQFELTLCNLMLLFQTQLKISLANIGLGNFGVGLDNCTLLSCQLAVNVY